MLHSIAARKGWFLSRGVYYPGRQTGVVIAGDKEYVVGEDGFEPVYYDVSTKEPVKTNAFKLGVNQTILNIRYYNRNKISLSQGSSVIMTRSKFEPLNFMMISPY